MKPIIKNFPRGTNSTNRFILGLGKETLPWGESVEVDIETLCNVDKITTYELNDFLVPTCVFKAIGKEHDKEPPINDILHYGVILTDDELCDRCDEMAAWARIRMVNYNNNIYYIKMVNGEVEEFKKVGVVG